MIVQTGLVLTVGSGSTSNISSTVRIRVFFGISNILLEKEMIFPLVGFSFAGRRYYSSGPGISTATRLASVVLVHLLTAFWTEPRRFLDYDSGFWLPHDSDPPRLLLVVAWSC
jgi:hypothetical protein